MKKPEPGWVNCLGVCGKKFYSKDKVRRRICPDCTRRNERIRVKKEFSTWHDEKHQQE